MFLLHVNLLCFRFILPFKPLLLIKNLYWGELLIVCLGAMYYSLLVTLLLFVINKFVEVFFSVFPSVALCGDRVLSTVRNDFPRLSLCTSWRDVWSMMPQRPDIHRRCDIGVFTMSGQERTLRVWTHLVRTEDIEDHHRHEGGFYRRYRYRDLSNMNPLVFQFIMYIYIYVFVLYKIL